MTTFQMNDDLLKQYVDGIFERYDIDHSQTLTLDELVVFFNDLLVSRGANQRMSAQQVQQSLRVMDTNNDGHITKLELFNALKKMNNGQFNMLAPQTNNPSQIPLQSNSTVIQYPHLSSVVIPPKQTLQQQSSSANLYVKPQVQVQATTNYIPSQIVPVTSGIQQIYQPSINTIPTMTVQPVPYMGMEVPKRTIINQHEVIQPIIPAPSLMPPPMMMPYGPGMGMGMGPFGPPMGMGYMGPPAFMGPMGGPFGLSPLSIMLGSLFGFPMF